LREISNSAFDDSGVKTIEIPDKCEGFNGSSLLGLEFVTISSRNNFLMFKDGFLVKDKGNTLIRYFGNSNRVLIKSFVEIISGGCFRKCASLREIVIESDSKLKEIGDSAFLRSGIESIRIPNKVENIGKNCFRECESLCEVVFESNSKLKKISDGAFSDSGIKSIQIPSNVENIGNDCFRACEYLSEITFESSLSIGSSAFSYCPLKCVKVAKGVIVEYEFPENCTIHELDLTQDE
jgi:hypothetical protein